MILVCGGIADAVTELVCARLTACGYPYRLLDLGRYPAGFDVHWCWHADATDGFIASRDWRVDLTSLTGIYVRYLGSEGRVPPPDIAEPVVPAIFAEYDAGLSLLFEDLPCAVVNRLRGGLSNHSKPYQALLLEQCGMRTPSTLITNDPDAVRRFYEECHADVIYKSVSGVRSIVRRLGSDQLARLPFLQHGPAQFQAFVPGDDVRVHTVGDRWFATRVRSTAVDYRYARREGGDTQMTPIDLPLAMVEACLHAAQSLGLLFAGIDLKLTPEGEYVCFEVNPSPGFLYYEQHTGQPISSALADLLHAGVIASEYEGEHEDDAFPISPSPASA